MPSSCGRSSWSPPQWRRHWAGCRTVGRSRSTPGEGRIAMSGTDTDDVIDMLVGIKAGSALDAIRRRRPVGRNQAQASYRALFAPEMPGEVTATERFAVAAFVPGLHGDAESAAFYTAALAATGASDELRRAIEAAPAAA